MSSTYSPDLRIELIGTGDQAGVWGVTTNTNLGTLIEQAVAGYTSVSISSSSQALTVYDGAEDQARYAAIALTTVTSANFNVYIPPSSKLYVLYNASSYTATIYCSTVAGNTTAAGTGIAIPTGKKMALWTDGTNVYQQNDYLISPTLITPALSAETYSTSAAVTAGTNAQGQGAMTSDINIVTTTAASPSGVTLPTATTGRIVTVVNKGTNAINVYPDTSAYIDNLSINTSIQIPVNSSLQFIASSTTRWYSSATGDTGSGANVRAVAPQLDAETYTTSATVSAAGTTQGTATALTSDYNIVTTVTSSANGVVLPTATTGRRIIIINRDAADDLNIYPATGASIDSLSTNAAFSLPVNGWLELNASSTTKWYSSYNAYIAEQTTATNATNLVTTNFSISESGGVLAFIAHPSFTASIASTTMTVTSASAGYVVYGATLTGTGVTGGTTVVAQLTSTETAAASPTYSSGGAIGDTNFVVSSATGISIGQMISGLGVPTGTYVLNVTGTTVYLGDRTGAPVEFTIQAAGTYNFRTAAAKGTYTVSASQTVASTTITGTKTVAQITNTGLITSNASL